MDPSDFFLSCAASVCVCVCFVWKGFILHLFWCHTPPRKPQKGGKKLLDEGGENAEKAILAKQTACDAVATDADIIQRVAAAAAIFEANLCTVPKFLQNSWHLLQEKHGPSEGNQILGEGPP